MRKIEKIKDSDIQLMTDIDPDIFKSDIDFYIDLFCQENNVQDLKLESNNFFNALMIDLYHKCIKNKYNLKMGVVHNTINNNLKTFPYNPDILTKILDIYIQLCYKYNKDININSFCLLTNIENDTVTRWGSYDPTTTHYGIYKKLFNGRQECLSAKLADGNKNPVGVIAILNHFYNWQTTASANGSNTKQAIESNNLPVLDDKNIIS